MQKWKVSKLCFELLNLSSALCLCLVPPLFFFLFLISLFLKCTHTHTHTHMFMYYLQAHWLSRVQLFATPWTVACQTLLSTEFSRQEYWNGLPCSSPYVLTNSFQKKVINVYILFECTHSLVKDCKFIDKFHEESRSIISRILSYLGGEGQCIYHDMFNQIA